MLSLEQITKGVQLIANDYPITKAELFGSYANGTCNEASDVDLLLEFSTPGISLLTLSDIKQRLEAYYNTEVDVIHGPLAEDSLLEIERKVVLYGA
ncbi:MAG: nucleotidyltransferase domain-containing protein [Firmicutes bacterium]|nr:nucleotidyltransferase domain-containing protein [Bacillota bacterium]